MDENEWLASTDPAAMLDFVTRRPQQPAATNRRRISDRKLRLFACACCRQVWHLLADPRSREAVKVSEKYADDTHTSDEWGPAHNAAVAVRVRPKVGNLGFDYLHAAWMAEHTVSTVPNIAEVMRHHTLILGGRVTAPRVQANLLRDIVGNPFRPVVLQDLRPCEDCPSGRPDENCDDCMGLGTVDHGPSPWLTPLVVAIAQTAYDERLPDGTLDPVGLAMLSDALEEAGCPTHVECPKCKGRRELPDPVYFKLCTTCLSPPTGTGNIGRYATGEVPHPILAHLRSPGPHYRGCWAVDLLLGKE